MPQPKARELSHDEMSLLEEGLEEFDNGRYWHAHESWEDLWNSLKRRFAPPEEVLLVQGMIQTSALLLHYENKNHRGVTSQWEKLYPKLQDWGVAWGLDIATHLTAIETFAVDVNLWSKDPRGHLFPRA